MKRNSHIARLASTALVAAIGIFMHPALHAGPAVLEYTQSIPLESMQASRIDFSKMTQVQPADSASGGPPGIDPEQKSVANGLYMTGTFASSWAAGVVAVNLTGEIRNDSFTRNSGTLQLQLWATTTPPSRGGAFTGYRLASSPNITALQTRTFYTNYTFTGTFSYPPDGTYWIVLSLAEHDSVTCAGFADIFCVNQDSMNSNATSTFGVAAPVVTSSLENPQPGSYQSGIGLISGWSCNGPNISYSVDGGSLQFVPFGSARTDTGAVCNGGLNTGFGALVNFSALGTGVHSVQLYVNGAPSGGIAYFTVTAPSGSFLIGASKEVSVSNFPTAGRTATLMWQQATQNFGIKSIFP